MAYTPHEWESGEVLTPTKLNTLTTAIGEMDMSYTPKTWHDGDILSAAEMNRIENAVASGGGGGGGDFTMFTVTLTNNSSSNRSVVLDLHDFSVDPNAEHCTGFYIHDDYGIYTYFDDALEIIEDETVTQDIYMIPNTAIYIFSLYISDASITGSATATTLDGEDCIRVTGDCTITFL